jgi:hypothetical protein
MILEILIPRFLSTQRLPSAVISLGGAAGVA